jgi:peptide/nickel transport system substrate-binding protein
MALSIDIVRVAIASYRGAATISALAVPPTGLYPQYYFEPLEPWLNNYTLNLGDGTSIRPYDPNVAVKIADEARKTLGDLVPTNSGEIRKAVGAGWWRRDLAAAEKLMLKAGLRRDSRNMWVFSDGTPFKVAVLAEGETRPTMNRAASMIVENWREFGIDATLDVRDNASRSRLSLLGEYDVELGWTIETWGGHPDLFFFLESWHSKLYRPNGQNAVGRNRMRWRNSRLDEIIDNIQKLDFDDPEVITLGQEYCKLSVEEMPLIPLMSYNVFSVCDETYWTGFPSAEDPYTDPVPNWGNSRYMFVKIKPKK